MFLAPQPLSFFSPQDAAVEPMNRVLFSSLQWFGNTAFTSSSLHNRLFSTAAGGPIKVISDAKEMRAFSRSQRAQGKTVAFVPTMVSS